MLTLLPSSGSAPLPICCRRRGQRGQGTRVREREGRKNENGAAEGGLVSLIVERERERERERGTDGTPDETRAISTGFQGLGEGGMGQGTVRHGFRWRTRARKRERLRSRLLSHERQGRAVIAVKNAILGIFYY